MNEEEMRLNEKLPNIAEYTKSQLPEGYGFVTLCFKFGEHANGDRLLYIANGNRSDIAKAMQEWINKVNSDEKFGKDI